MVQGLSACPKQDTENSPPENERHTDSAIYIYSYSRVYPVVGGSDNFKCQLYRGLVI